MKDNTTGAGIAGVPVTLAFQGQGVVNPTAITDANGNYSVGPVPAGKYGKLIVNGAGYVPISTAVTVAASGSRADFQVTRDWAAASGGAKVVDFNGPDYTEFGCGPVHAIDTSLVDRLGQHHRQPGTPDQPVQAEVHHRRHAPEGQHHPVRGRPGRDLR